MRVKRYIVDTMPDAMLKIRKDLGGDAIILSTKKIKVGGFLGMFGKAKLEVIAGVDPDERPASKGPERQVSAVRQQPVKLAAVPRSQPVSQTAKSADFFAAAQESGNVPSSLVPPEREIEREPETEPAAQPAQTARGFAPQAYRRTTELFSGSQEGQPAGKLLPAKGVTAVKEPDDPSERSQPEPTAASAASGLAFSPTGLSDSYMEPAAERTGTNTNGNGNGSRPPGNPSPETSDLDFRDKLLEDIRQMKALIRELSQAQKNERELPEPLERFMERFRRQDVDANLAESWIDPAYNRWKESGGTLGEHELTQEVKAQLEQFLEGRISAGFADSTRMVYVAGPTGVGKTTTIAKMAADQIFRRHKKVGFITADTYRISAVEQLRTYASILNVPLEVVQSPGDMKRAITRMENCDLIFMDTAGRNYLNELHVAELHSLLTYREYSETCLVLSLTAKPDDMKAITDRFSTYGLDKVIFTKLDETNSCGPMFNLLADYPLQLLYLTNGQTVPDDILSVDRELLIKQLLGEDLL